MLLHTTTENLGSYILRQLLPLPLSPVSLFFN
jgi:hypothetical protein